MPAGTSRRDAPNGADPIHIRLDLEDYSSLPGKPLATRKGIFRRGFHDPYPEITNEQNTEG